MKSNCYALKAVAVVQLRGEIPDAPLGGHTLALLTSGPPPEGAPLNELDEPGYARQPLDFVFASEGVSVGAVLRSANRIVFASALGWPDASHAAIIDERGATVGYGRLQPAPGHAGRYDVAFEATAIELRFK